VTLSPAIQSGGHLRSPWPKRAIRLLDNLPYNLPNMCTTRDELRATLWRLRDAFASIRFREFKMTLYDRPEEAAKARRDLNTTQDRIIAAAAALRRHKQEHGCGGSYEIATPSGISK
jgi:hypothetical protein